MEDANALYRELAKIHNEYLEKSGDFDHLLERQNKTTQNIQILYQAHDSFKELVKVFEEQMELHKQNSKSITAHEYSKWVQYVTSLTAF